MESDSVCSVEPTVKLEGQKREMSPTERKAAAIARGFFEEEDGTWVWKSCKKTFTRLYDTFRHNCGESTKEKVPCPNSNWYARRLLLIESWLMGKVADANSAERMLSRGTSRRLRLIVILLAPTSCGVHNLVLESQRRKLRKPLRSHHALVDPTRLRTDQFCFLKRANPHNI